MSKVLRRTAGGLKIAALMVFELVVSSLAVAWDVITPRHRSRPGILALPLDVRTDLEITVFANLLSLTPGTLGMDVSADRRFLYLHAMFIDDPAAVRTRLKHTFERRVLEALR